MDPSRVGNGGDSSHSDPSSNDHRAHARQAFSQNAWTPQTSSPSVYSVHGPAIPGKPVFSSTSSAAIVSLIFGIISPIFFVLCLTSLITSLVAIICGHVSLYSIKRSQGRLTGQGFAISGLVIGYLMMTLTIAMIVWLATLKPTSTSSQYAEYETGGVTADDRLRSAELAVLSDDRGSVGSGNSNLAEELANEFGTDMKTITDNAFTEGRKRIIQLSGGKFLPYCELHEDSCAFIVHVPSYKDYEKDAKDVLAEIAWQEAVMVTTDVLDEGDSLAVALRGTFLYGDIMIGAHPGPINESSTWRSADRDELLAFFPEVTSSLGTRPEAEADADTNFDFFNQATEPATDAASNPLLPSPEESQPSVPQPDFSQPDRSQATSSAKPAAKRPETPAFENKIPVQILATMEPSNWNIQSLSFSNDGRFVLAGGLDQTIGVYDVASQKRVFQCERLNDLGQVVALAVTRDNNHLIAAGYRGGTALFDIQENGSLAKAKDLFQFSGEVKCLVTSQAFDFVLGGDRKGTLAWQPYDERSISARTINPFKSQVLAAHLPASGVKAMATDGANLIQFSLSSGEILQQHPLQRGVAHSAAFDASGEFLAISRGSEIEEYSTTNGQLHRTYTKIPAGEKGGGLQWSVAYHPVQPWIVSGGSGAATVWDRTSAERLAVLASDTNLYIQSLAFTPDGERLAIVPAAAGQSIKVFQLGE